MKTFGIAIFVIVFPFLLNGQDNNPSRCALLQTVLDSASHLHIGFDSNTVIVDTLGYFKDCKVTVRGTTIKITNVWSWSFSISRNQVQQMELDKRYRHYFVLVHSYQKEDKAGVYFWHPRTNKTLDFKLKTEKGQLIITDVSSGNF